MTWKTVFADPVRRFALEIEEESGRRFVSIPVSNRMAEYTEWYEVDAPTFERFVADPASAHAFVGCCERRELDLLLLLPPGSDRGVAG